MESGPGVGRPWALTTAPASGGGMGGAGSEGRSGVTLGSAFGPEPGPAEDLTQPSVLSWIPSHMFVVRTTGPSNDGVQP